MHGTLNKLMWNGQPGHYEVYYLTLTDPASGVGVWIRYTMVAPLVRTGKPATSALWFLTMNPRRVDGARVARKAVFPIERLDAREDPFELRIGAAVLSGDRMTGGFDDVSWDLRWSPGNKGYEHVHPALRRLGLAKTVLALPQADLAIDGTLAFAGERIELSGARGAQAHIWGSKHASSWAWAHCNDLRTLAGDRVEDTFVDGVSVFVPRFGRELGPSTPVVGRICGSDFCSTSPLRVIGNHSTFALTGWRFEAIDGPRKLLCEVDADRDQLAGVTYHDPDGDLAYCYNSETATMRLHVFERASQVGGWGHRSTLVAPGLAHFEYAQRTPVPGLELHTS